MNVGKYLIENQQSQPNQQQQPLQQTSLQLVQQKLVIDSLQTSHLVFINHHPIQIKFRYFSPSLKHNSKSYHSHKESFVKQSKISKLKKITLDIDANQVSQIFSVADQNYSRSSRSRKRKKKTIKTIKQTSELFYKKNVTQIKSNILNEYEEFHKQIFDIKIKKKKIIKLNPNRFKISKIETYNKQNQEDQRFVNSSIISKYETPIRAIYLIDKSRLSQKLVSQQINRKSHSKSSKICMVSKQMNKQNRKSDIKIFLNKQKNNENMRNNFRFQTNNNHHSQINSKVNSRSRSRKGISVTSSSRSELKKLPIYSKLTLNKNKNCNNINRQVQIIKVTQKKKQKRFQQQQI